MSLAQALISYAQTGGSRGVGDIYAALAASRATRAQAMPAVRRPRASASHAGHEHGPALALQRKGNVLVLPTSWKGTHPTSGAQWNSQGATATDIMAAAGTIVGAPEPGRVVRHGSAQGGEALYFDRLSDPDSDPDYWFGHIDQMVPVGTVIRRRGGRIAVVSPDHPAPHVHADRIYGSRR